ncbi:MAG: VPLPA-CTERM sorting domain-containing protein [Pseudomonadota bacterium]
MIVRAVFAAVAALSFVAPTLAGATTVSNAGVYGVADRISGPGIITHGLVRDNTGTILTSHEGWSINQTDSRWTLNNDGTANLELYGTNTADSQLNLWMNMSFKVDDRAYDGVCMGYANMNCAQDPQGRPIFDTTDWQYFQILSGSMNVSSTLASVTYALEDIAADKPTQFGYGANAWDLANGPDDLGASGWYGLTEISAIDLDDRYNFEIATTGSKHTDINMRAAEIAPVPLPAGFTLMLGAIGAAGLIRRKAA